MKPAATRAKLGVIGRAYIPATFSTLPRANGEDIKAQQELMHHADISHDNELLDTSGFGAKTPG